MSDFNPLIPSDTVFLGDSLTESFDLIKFFGRQKLRNQGISGETTGDILYRLHEVIRAKPARLFLMIGINDLYQGIPVHQVFSNIKNILGRFIRETPGTKLFVQSILPVNEPLLFTEDRLNPVIHNLNRMLKDYCLKNKLIFIDLHIGFLDQNGQLGARYTYDGVHLTHEGYLLWSQLVGDYLI
ncbi:MAG: GDSL-type esterase/lipase family protein [Bacteroidales bacterium]